MNEKALFLSALEENDPAERGKYLDEACAGDTEVRHRVEALLRCHEAAGAFLEVSPWEQLVKSGCPGADDPRRYGLSAPQEPDEIGRLGKYRILRRLGSGGMGIVFEAEHSKLKHRVALKIMNPLSSHAPTANARFLREAQAAAKLRHPNVVSIHDFDEANGVAFYTMELLEGESLETRVEREGRLPLGEVVRIGREVAGGLAVAHEQGLIHRDVKPGNLWIDSKNKRVVILDLGLAKMAAEPQQAVATPTSETAPVCSELTLTKDGAIPGTPPYMAPEQLRGEGVGPHSDLFSLGRVLYRLAKGRLPNQAPDRSWGTPDSDLPSQLLDFSDLPSGLAALIRQLLDPIPERRPMVH